MKTGYPLQWAFGLLSLVYPFFSKTDRFKVVLTAFHGDGYRGNTKLIFEKLLNHPYLYPVWLSRNHNVVNRINQESGNENAFLVHSLRGLRELSSAQFLVFTHGTSDFPFLKLPPKAIKIQTYHGLPTKRGEYLRPTSDKKPNMLHRLILWYRFHSINYFLSSSPYVTRIFSQRFSLPRQNFLESGYPCYDELITGEPDHNLIKKTWPDAPHYEKIILYAPTFRKLKKTKWFPFDDYNINKIASYLEEKQVLMLLRAHPNEKLDTGRYMLYSNRILDASQHVIENVYDLLQITDLIITDYSSIFLEGLLKDIPSVFLPYDLETYERGLSFNYQEWLPGPIATNQKQFLEEIEWSLSDKNRTQKKRAEIRDRFFSTYDGGATDRFIQFLENNVIR